ncbi:hypothetical protein BLA29_008066 [Euroglyphus maynei]|uniref:Uncharacterized protein n=1 Tax=Euroglyphus maynei TaxID=6958 RepID=A0A1Y3BVW8_EURMA|nr:hypothetical protein BLA29_008066 [Euroglyphus maynei]
MAEWQQQSCNNRRRRNHRKHWKRLWLEMMTIRLGLKPSYTWDLSMDVDDDCHNEIYRIFDEINIDYDCRPNSYDGGWPMMNDRHSLNIVKLSSPVNTTTTSVVFFGNIQHMIENINSTLIQLDIWIQSDHNCQQNNETYLIDVSADLDEPKIIHHQQHQNNEEEKTILLSLKYCLLHIRNQLSIVVGQPYDIHIDNEKIFNDNNHYCDLCAITGILIGYPIIYCNRSTDVGNCLANQSLRNYLIRMENIPKTKTNDDDSFIIYSFSVPDKFN